MSQIQSVQFNVKYIAAQGSKFFTECRTNEGNVRQLGKRRSGVDKRIGLWNHVLIDVVASGPSCGYLVNDNISKGSRTLASFGESVFEPTPGIFDVAKCHFKDTGLEAVDRVAHEGEGCSYVSKNVGAIMWLLVAAPLRMRSSLVGAGPMNVLVKWSRAISLDELHTGGASRLEDVDKCDAPRSTHNNFKMFGREHGGFIGIEEVSGTHGGDKGVEGACTFLDSSQSQSVRALVVLRSDKNEFCGDAADPKGCACVMHDVHQEHVTWRPLGSQDDEPSNEGFG